MTVERQGPWAVLDIAPTQDARQIKRAYAARLKVVRPDEDATGFQALREAYEWATAQCESTPAQPVIHLQMSAMRPRSVDTEVAPELAGQADVADKPDIDAPDATPPERPDFSPRQRPAPVFLHRQPPPVAIPVPGSAVGVQHWRAFLDALPDSKDDDLSEERVGVITAQLRERLQHPDLVSFEARDTFVAAALHLCAGADAAGALRLACDSVFGWTGSPMPLDAYERQRWLSAVDRAAGDRQYADLQTYVRWRDGLGGVLQPGAPVPYRRLFRARFQAEVRGFFQRLQTNWPQALRYRLDAEALQVWQEAAYRPWPSFEGLITLGLLSLLGAIMFWSTGQDVSPSPLHKALGGGGVAVVALGVAVLPFTLRVLYPLWILPGLRRLRERADRVSRSYVTWYAIRITVPTLPFFANSVPAPYANAVTMAVTVALCLTATVHAMVLLLYERARVLAVIPLAALFYGVLMWEAFRPFYAYGFAVLLLADTLFFGLRETLARSRGADWQASRPRLVLLATGAVLVPLQIMLARDLPVLAAVAGWAWFIVGCSMVDAFLFVMAQRKAVGSNYLWLIFMGLSLVGSRLAAHHLVDNGSPIAGVLALQLMVAWLALLALAAMGWGKLVKYGRRA